MELKEFIVETISAIADATTELQEKYAAQDIVINPPSAQSGSDVFQVDSQHYTMRRVQNVSFDVAVTVATESSGKASASLKVWSLEVGGEGGRSVQSEHVSRVGFTIPMTLKPSGNEAINMDKKMDASKALHIPPRSAPGAGRKF